MIEYNANPTTEAFRSGALAMGLAHKNPYAGLDNSPTSVSERLLSGLENEADLLVSWLHRYRRSISVSCGAVAYLIGWGAIFLLAAWGKGERFGYQGLYYINDVSVVTTDQWGYRELKQHEAILPSFKFFELLVAGTAVGVAGVKVAYVGRHRTRSVIIPVLGLILMLVAWLALPFLINC
jgi:hypothetical protein